MINISLALTQSRERVFDNVADVSNLVNFVISTYVTLGHSAV